MCISRSLFVGNSLALDGVSFFDPLFPRTKLIALRQLQLAQQSAKCQLMTFDGAVFDNVLG